MSEFTIPIKKKEIKKTLPVKREPRAPKKRSEELSKQIEEMNKKIRKMFRAACNGKRYYQRWFPEFKDSGDFETGFYSLVDKLCEMIK